MFLHTVCLAKNSQAEVLKDCHGRKIVENTTLLVSLENVKTPFSIRKHSNKMAANMFGYLYAVSPI
jgi:hypothetical protein